MLEHPEIGWIERTGYPPSWLQEQEDFCDDDCEELREEYVRWNGAES